MTILISGAGIAGLTLGLTLHQLGLPFRIFERVRDLQPLGVGINLQPHAVRELTEMGLADMLDSVGLRTQDYGFYTRTGLPIWTEPRGRAAGYHWPQYSVHRGRLQLALAKALTDRAGPDCIAFGHALTGHSSAGDTVTAQFATDAGAVTATGALLIGADGIRSALRAQFYPDEGPPVWGGAIMWRATTQARPFLTGASMILAGNDHQRFVSYPISAPDPATGLATINWIAEKRVDPATHVSRGDWNRAVPTDAFRSDFDDWRFDWLDIPALIDGADTVYEYPMVDRDPLDAWTFGRATLIGDAAHATHPVGSSGASQAILDARLLGAAIRTHGPTPDAAQAYEAQVRPMANAVTLANRSGGGPDAIMQMAEDRCGGDFTRLGAALPMAERAAHAARYKKLAGFSIAEMNARPPILPT
jgi:2-polyprenyl-6-methoxyphenol hydroxylase-like FAD-dependent oxidoreductase